MNALFAHSRALLGIVVVAGMLALALWPETVNVDTATVTRGPLVVTVDEEGRTRVRDRFIVSAPVSGRVLRIELEPGDRVERRQTVARLDAGAAPLLDPRTRQEATAAVEAARAAFGAARAAEQRARAALAQAEREFERAERLFAAGVVPAQERDTRADEARLARESANTAEFAAKEAAADLVRAEARLAPTTSRVAGSVVTVQAPVSGVVLRRLRESEAIVPAGEPLVEIGDPSDLEIVSDLLSSDAVQIREGARVMIEQWGRDDALEGAVRRIEPAAFTKVSALGVEEQRVNVVVDLVDSDGEDPLLGDAYRVDVRIVVWEAGDVLKVPTAALFRRGEGWATYVIRDGRARVEPVTIGRRTGREAEVVAGLAEGAQVVVHPPDALSDGARVAEHR